MSNDNPNQEETTPEKVAKELGLEYTGKGAFLELCAKGCDPLFLQHLISTLFSEPLPVTPKLSEEPYYQRECYEISWNPLDSFETALEGVEIRDLKALPKQLRKMADQLYKVNFTRLVRYMEKEGAFGSTRAREQIFGLPNALHLYADTVIPLILSRAKEIGDRQAPGFTKRLTDIYHHVHGCTGNWLDSLISKILVNVYPEQGNSFDEANLKQWRKRQELVSPRGTRKSKSL